MKNGMVVEDANKRWYLNDELHRVDGPAEEMVDGSKFWYLNGILHRVDGPAVEWAGILHRVDGPAEEYADGTKFWYLNGKKHRVDGPAIEWGDGDKHWYLNGEPLIHPDTFDTMEEWVQYLNESESETYQLIHYYNGFIGFINNPSAKQTRVHQMAHLL